MAIAFRKSVAVTTLALSAAFLPAGTAGAAGTAHRTADTPAVYCLTNTWHTPDISSQRCDSSNQGQRWTITGDRISLTDAPSYCLSNTWGGPEVSSRPCDASNDGQYWSIDGEQISLTFAPGYCLANTWYTPDISVKPCDTTDPGQHWAVFGDQISLASV
jgi:hypothetical protein